MQLGTDEIFLIPYQMARFEEQERKLSERTEQVSAQLEAAFSGRDVGPFLDNTLASAWFRVHQDNLDHYAHSSDEVGLSISSVSPPDC